MSLSIPQLFLAGLIVAFLIWGAHQLSQHLEAERIRTRRRGGDSERVRFEVQLSRDHDDAAEAMLSLVSRKLPGLAETNRDARSKGLGSVDIILLGYRANGLVRCDYLVECDRRIFEALKRAFKQDFHQSVKIRTAKYDPIENLSRGLRAPPRRLVNGIGNSGGDGGS